MERSEIPLDVNPLSGEGVTHTVTVKHSKVPLALLGCGRRLGMCCVLWGEESQCQTGWECRRAGSCERFPSTHLPGRDGCTKHDFPWTHLLYLLLPFAPYPTPSASCAWKKTSYLHFLAFPQTCLTKMSTVSRER